MRKYKIAFWTMLFIVVSPIVIYGEEGETATQESSHEQQSEHQKTGLVTDLVNVVVDTVTSTGDVVKKTVETTEKTIKATADFAENTVQVVTKPSAEKPVEKLITNTTEYVRDTVEHTTPVVNETVTAVKDTVQYVTKPTEVLPKVKQVTPIIEETVKAVDQTIEETEEYVNKTTETFVAPLSEKPVVQVVENTGKLVSETVSHIVPVIEATTESVQPVTNEVVNQVEQIQVISHVAPVVKEAVDVTVRATNQAVGLVNKTVTNVATPTEQPIKNVVKDTSDFISETVRDTLPVVKKTTEMVEAVVEDVTQVTEVLPELPVVTPHTDIPAESLVIPEKQSVPTAPEATKKPIDADKMIEQIPMEKPIVHQKVQPESNNENSSNQQEITDIEQSSTEQYEEFLSSTSIQAINSKQSVKLQERVPNNFDSSFRVEMPRSDARISEMIQEQLPLLPVDKEKKKVTGTSAVFTSTGSSSITSSAAVGSSVDVSASLLQAQRMNAKLVSKRWYAESIVGKLQWIHPPPGQPPQTTPFLYVSK